MSTEGEVVRGRCKATNLCDYCAKLAAVENAELLALDAMNGWAPSLWLILTTRWATSDMSLFYEAHRQLMRALSRRWPDLEWARLLEFTTGYGTNSGGLRRPHWNCFLKGLPATEAAIELVGELVGKVWCPRVDAEPQGQAVVPVEHMRGLTRYVALHFQKESQSPPDGFSGHRFTKSRGYLWTATPEAREEARDSLFDGRAVWKAALRGLEGDEAEDFVDRQWEQRINTRWAVWHEPSREGVNDESATHTRPAPESTGTGTPVGRLLDPPAPPRVGDRPDVDVTPASRSQEGPPPARAGVAPPPADPPPLASPADSRRPNELPTRRRRQDTPASLSVPVVDGERRPGSRARQVRESSQAERPRPPG